MSSQVETWLSELGLSKYAQAFADAEIDPDALPHLTEDDLKELGLPIGPRRKAMEAIKRLRDLDGRNPRLDEASNPSNSEKHESSPSHSTSSDVSLSPGAERRHLTVMFVDLVGSTEMAARLDPEDMRQIITRYQNTVAGVVARFEGFVAKFMGDGVLCYFGWPRANEDDAERSVRAGLDIITSIKDLKGTDGESLACRIGVATGVVIVGDLIGSGATQEAAVVGETPNLAARLQSLAQPNQLVLPRETRTLLGNVFQLEPLGSHSLKGIASTVEAYAVVGENRPESRFEGRQTGALTAIVGRDQELGLMHECWLRARSALGQVILVSGEAGIGKSRITRALIDKIILDEHSRITFQCSPYHTDSAFHPIVQHLVHAASIQPTDAIDARLDKLEILTGFKGEDAGLLAALLRIDGSGRYGAIELTPSQLRARTMRLLTRFVVELSKLRPLLIVFEDLHWVDPTSLEFLDVLLDAIADQSVLILATARPTFEHGFGGHPIVTRFALNRLGKTQIQDIVSKLTDGKSMPEAVLQLIANRTDGVPLFVEELTKTILESGILRLDGDALVLDRPLDAVAIPRTLHDSLMARLDRLQPIKEVAQTAACIGRDFDHRLLAKISTLSEADLGAALDGLIKAELVYRRGVPPDATYLFKHALVRDAAYESLLRERRRAIHARILEIHQASKDIPPEVLAQHAEGAGMMPLAIDLWEAASGVAIRRPAFDEAISQLERAIALISPSVEDGDRAVLERALSLQMQLGVALFQHRGYGADETKAAYQYALTLANRIGETPLRYGVQYGLWVGCYLRSEHDGQLAQAKDLLSLAKEPDEISHAHRTIGLTLCMSGRATDAQVALDQARAIYDPASHKGFEFRFGQDLGASIDCYAAINLALLGRTQEAHARAQAAETAAYSTGHANTICYMHSHLGIYCLLARDMTGASRHATQGYEMSAERGLVVWRNFSQLLGVVLSIGTLQLRGLSDYSASDAAFAGSKSRLWLTLYRTEAGRRALELGYPDEALRLSQMSETLIEDSGERFAFSDLRRLQADLAIRDGKRSEAEAFLSDALSIAREQGCKIFELRAAIDLARLWASLGQGSDGHALLRSLCATVADGDCPEEVRSARDLMS